MTEGYWLVYFEPTDSLEIVYLSSDQTFSQIGWDCNLNSDCGYVVWIKHLDLAKL